MNGSKLLKVSVYKSMLIVCFVVGNDNLSIMMMMKVYRNEKR